MSWFAALVFAALAATLTIFDQVVIDESADVLDFGGNYYTVRSLTDWAHDFIVLSYFE